MPVKQASLQMGPLGPPPLGTPFPATPPLLGQLPQEKLRSVPPACSRLRPPSPGGPVLSVGDRREHQGLSCSLVMSSPAQSPRS